MATVNIGRLKFKWQGNYSSGTAYVVDDVVYHGGNSYVCINDSTGNAPTNTSYWQKMAQGSDLGSLSGITQGDVVYYNGTDWTRLAAGTSGQFLKTNGSGANPVWDDVDLGTAAALDVGTGANNVVQLDSSGNLPALDGSALTGISAGGLVKVAEVEADNTSSSIAIDGCFTSTYKNYFYMVDGLICSNNSVGVNCYFRSGGSNLTAGSYRTFMGGGYVNNSNGATDNTSFGDWNGTVAYLTLGAVDDDGLGTFSYGYIFQPNVVDQTMLRGEVTSPHTTTQQRNYSIMIQYMGQTAIDGFRIDASAGTIQAGKLKIYGVVD